MILSTTIITNTDSEAFNYDLSVAIEQYQNQGRKVKVQFSTAVNSKINSVTFSALIIAESVM